MENTIVVDKIRLQKSVEAVIEAVELTAPSSSTSYRVFLAICVVATLLVWCDISTPRAADEALVALSAFSVCIWFFGVVYKLRNIVTPQILSLTPKFKPSVLRVLTVSWAAGTTLLSCAWVSPLFLVVTCVGYCLLMEVRAQKQREIWRIVWLIGAATAALYVVVTLPRALDLVGTLGNPVVAWASTAVLLAALGLACIFRLIGLVIFLGFGLLTIWTIPSIMRFVAPSTANVLAINATLIICAIFVFALLRKALVGLPIKWVKKLLQNKRREDAMDNFITRDNPALYIREWLPTFDAAFKLNMKQPFRFDAMLGLLLGRNAHWLGRAKWSVLLGIVAVAIYAIIELYGKPNADPNLRAMFCLCLGHAFLAGPILALKFTGREQEILSLSPRWPVAYALNQAFFKMSLQHVFIATFPLLISFIVAITVVQASLEVIIRSLLVWITFTNLGLACKLVNSRTLANMGVLEQFHFPLIFGFLLLICLEYLPDALFLLIAFSCVASCVLLAFKLRWFRAQGAVLPARRGQSFEWNWREVLNRSAK